jgi:hypothetical protein
MSYEHCHENAREEAAKMLGTCSLATEFKWHRHSCLCAVAKLRTRRMANAAASLSAKIPWPPWLLIANLELKLRLTHRKISPLGISNRKYFAISNRTWVPRPQRACHPSPITHHCFSNRDTAIRISPNPYHYSEFEISNRDKMTVLRIGFFRLGFHKPYSEFLPQIDHAAPRAYTGPSAEGESSWKIPSY